MAETLPDANHTWMISKKAHDDITYGIMEGFVLAAFPWGKTSRLPQ
jgi:hypothetical protein